MRVKRIRIGQHTFANTSEVVINSDDTIVPASELPWKWSINGTEVATTKDLTWAFTVPGFYKVVLESADPRFVGGVVSEAIQVLNTAPQITSEVLPDCNVGADYMFYLEGIGGTAPYSWKGHLLPAGLYLLSNGVLAGKPTIAGVFSFTVDMWDANKELSTKTLSITSKINPPPEVVGG